MQKCVDSTEGGEMRFVLSSVTEAIPFSATGAKPLLWLPFTLLLVRISQPYSGWLQVGRNVVPWSECWNKECAFSRQFFVFHHQYLPQSFTESSRGRPYE